MPMIQSMAQRQLACRHISIFNARFIISGIHLSRTMAIIIIRTLFIGELINRNVSIINNGCVITKHTLSICFMNFVKTKGMSTKKQINTQIVLPIANTILRTNNWTRIGENARFLVISPKFVEVTQNCYRNWIVSEAIPFNATRASIVAGANLLNSLY